ncbi:hypothetical protein B0H11DRAFT_1934686 [Mycena galericulata]|nr:hypothetical protein B0H11DRAFT_1934686 [Mycena galericulata]
MSLIIIKYLIGANWVQLVANYQIRVFLMSVKLPFLEVAIQGRVPEVASWEALKFLVAEVQDSGLIFFHLTHKLRVPVSLDIAGAVGPTSPKLKGLVEENQIQKCLLAAGPCSDSTGDGGMVLAFGDPHIATKLAQSGIFYNGKAVGASYVS